MQRFAVSRTLSSPELLHDAVVAPLVDALLSRRLQTEEAAIFTLGDAKESEGTLISSCLRCMLNGLTASPRELIASALAVHAADAHTALSREVVTDIRSRLRVFVLGLHVPRVPVHIPGCLAVRVVS